MLTWAYRQPTWTSDPPERAKWEWRRVKRSLSSKERREAIEDLQRRNTALRNCFEQQELSTITAPTHAIETLQKRFDLERCNTTRSHVTAIHRALRRGWNCNCALPHQAALDLQWHNTRGASQAKQRFDLTLLYPPKSPCGGSNTCAELWYKTNMWVVEEQAVDPSAQENAQENGDVTVKVEAQDAGKSRVSRKSLRFNLPLRKPAPLAPCDFNNLPASDTPSPKRPINSLCGAFLEAHETTVLGFLLDTDASGKSSQVHLSSAQRTLSSPLQLISLRSLLTTQSMRQLKLSRKQRLGLAAAMAWAVLYLGESPWLAETWQKDHVQFMLDNSSSQLELLSDTPCISCHFHNSGLSCATGGELGGDNAPNDDPLQEPLQYKLVRNRTLFALGIFLVEVGFNRSFEELREQVLLDDGKQWSILEDYQLAIELADELHLDAGPEYGDAIKRCLRCEFPGRDITKHFYYAQFRQEFFNGVVAPVQATFDCYSC
ncbi:hypothetical protein P168DRAFT_155748 [Aspergillus campestris IBT 28561]|uniref:DUF7580 domain-containing protein n=1 Tax=Aspergillus campestris (strain IBT 28561) TaxID=1392248 RepID=A0A2I1D352_ASPC2|nr:uncharacterized protein P168DRAFT_155748 [Aspergillus campestris IBT 28561]PKY04299.1 hypothetical protein P168DRAFT_155748 [Aspergillus campestris IBT 28561]